MMRAQFFGVLIIPLITGMEGLKVRWVEQWNDGQVWHTVTQTNEETYYVPMPEGDHRNGFFFVRPGTNGPGAGNWMTLNFGDDVCGVTNELLYESADSGPTRQLSHSNVVTRQWLEITNEAVVVPPTTNGCDTCDTNSVAPVP